VAYEPLWERFEATAPSGARLAVQFLRAGFLTLGDRPELYFFRVTHPADAPEASIHEIVVGLSGDALRRFQDQRRRGLGREEKIDVAGLLLKKSIEAGKSLDSNNLFIRDEALAALAAELRISE
jgi:hypothetical protein